MVKTAALTVLHSDVMASSSTQVCISGRKEIAVKYAFASELSSEGVTYDEWLGFPRATSVFVQFPAMSSRRRYSCRLEGSGTGVEVELAASLRLRNLI